MQRWLIIGDPGWAPLVAWADGLRSAGIAFSFLDHRDNWMAAPAADAVAIYGLRAQGQDILDFFAARGVPVVVIDHGYMRRVHRTEDFGHGHFQVGIGRLGWVPDKAPSADRLLALGIEARQRERRPLKRALIMGQVAFDASHRLTADRLVACYEALADELREARIPNVAFRGHPLGPTVRPRIQPDDMDSLEGAIARADLVVSLNSNAGLDAIIAGCPAVRLMPSHYDSLAYKWPVLPALIEAPPVEQVTAYLERLAYAQWNAAEIQAGAPLRFLQSLGAVP